MGLQSLTCSSSCRLSSFSQIGSVNMCSVGGNSGSSEPATSTCSSHWRDCYSAAPPSTFGRCFRMEERVCQ